MDSKTLKKREEISEEYKWKLNKIFSTDEEWKKNLKY